MKDTETVTLEDRLKADGSFQHILKFAPQSQRELMTFELANYFIKLFERVIEEAKPDYAIHPTHNSGQRHIVTAMRGAVSAYEQNLKQALSNSGKAGE